MAAFALDPEYARMDDGFFVAAVAVLGQAGESLVLVAVSAVQVLVFAIQRVDLGMFEIGVAVGPIVAAHTVRPEGINMYCQGVMVFGRMAGDTIQSLRDKPFLAVAALAVQRVVVKIQVVFDQAETGQELMVDVGIGEGSDHGLLTFVLSVAGFTIAGAGQVAVQAGIGGPFLGHFLVAVLAAGIDNTVDGPVAVTTVILEFGVGNIAIDFITGVVDGG